MWTIFNHENKAVANCNFEPNHADLATRGECACFHAEPIALPEALPAEGTVRRKPLVSFAAKVANGVAEITVDCEDDSIREIPLLIGGITVTKPVGSFVINGEPGIALAIDFDHTGLRGNGLEVLF
ncbi:MAG TPA: hypothetical protein VN462_07610 [Negativicutes bacterium]|nr:hypothetical protein [Negativicutes bacterium]